MKRAAKACVHCGVRIRSGRGAVHLSGECQTAWYRRWRGRGRPPVAKKPDDIPAELIERIMRRRAAEQRYERAMASDG